MRSRNMRLLPRTDVDTDSRVTSDLVNALTNFQLKFSTTT